MKRSLRIHGSSLPVALVLFLLGCAAVISLVAGRDARGPSARLTLDAWYYHAYLASLFNDGDLDFTNEYRVTGNWERLGITARGRPANHFTIGAPLLSAPFYLLGDLFDSDESGFGKTQVKITLIASPFYSVLALLFAYRVLRRRLGPPIPALAAPVLLAVAGPVIFYAFRQPGYPHPAAMFVTTWLIDVWDRSYDRPRTFLTWVGMGALLGMAALVRTQLVLWGILLIAAAIDDLWQHRARALAVRWGAAVATAIIVFTPQLLAWRAIYGSAFLLPQGSGFMAWTSPKWSEVLFSTRNGLFAWTPLYAVAALGLVAMLPRQRRLAGLLIVGVAAQVIVNGAAWDWWGGPGFGQRRLDSCFLPFALGLGALLAQGWSRRRPGIAIAAMTAILALVCAYANYRMVRRLDIWDVMHLGGQPITESLRGKMPRRLTGVIGTLSFVATLPARAWFALQHGVPLDRYDRVVGEHFLTEVFPGTGGPSRPVEKLRLAGSEPFLVGFEPTPDGARMLADHATVLVPLNKRHGPVYVTFESPVALRLTWDGKPVQGGVLDPIERGVHDLDIEAPAGTVIKALTLEIKPGTPP